MSFNDLLPLFFSVLLSLCTVVGGLIALKKDRSKEAQAIEARVIAAQEKELKILRQKIEDLERDRNVQDRVISTIRHLLKEYGLHIVIDGDVVSVKDQSGGRKVVRIHQDRFAKAGGEEE